MDNPRRGHPLRGSYFRIETGWKYHWFWYFVLSPPKIRPPSRVVTLWACLPLDPQCKEGWHEASTALGAIVWVISQFYLELRALPQHWPR